MRQLIFKFMRLACVVLIAGCYVKGGDPSSSFIVGSDLNAQLDKSFSTWQSLKNNANYQYTTSFSSWVGFGNKTTIHVKHGKVNKREYRAWDRTGNTTGQWVEGFSELRSHTTGAALLTMQVIYDQCSLLLENKNTAEHYFQLSFDDAGILKQCSYSAKNCADDCSSGFHIEKLKFHRQQ